MSSSIKPKGDLSQSGKAGKRTSNRNYALHGKAKKISSALKNVFRSDNKEDRLKVDDTLSKSPSTENLKTAAENVSTVFLSRTTCHSLAHLCFKMRRLINMIQLINKETFAQEYDFQSITLV